MGHPGHADEALDKLQHGALFLGGVRSLGTNFAAMWCMFKSHVRIVCTVPYDTLMIAAMSLMGLRRSSCTSRRIVSTFLGAELMEVGPDLSSSSSDVLPLLTRVPLETPRATHGLISIRMLYHFKSLRSRFAEFHAEFDVCSLLQFHVHAEIANVKAHVVTNTRVV